jgi:hypothetical protein
MSGRQESKFWGVILTLGLTLGGLFFLFATMEESRGMPNAMPVFAALAAAGIYVALIRGPIGRAIAKMLEGQQVQDDHLVMRVEQLEDRLSEFGMDQLRVAELEERLDFAERLLSQREPAGALRKSEHP